LPAATACRPVWLAANTTLDETLTAIKDLHQSLEARFPDLLTVIAPKEVVEAQQALSGLRAAGLEVALWSELSLVRCICSCSLSVALWFRIAARSCQGLVVYDQRMHS